MFIGMMLYSYVQLPLGCGDRGHTGEGYAGLTVWVTYCTAVCGGRDIEEEGF